MPTYRLQTSLQDVSGLPRDQYVNTLHWSTPTDPVLPATWGAIAADTTAFYTSIAGLLSQGVAMGGHTLKVYRVGAPLGSPPVFTNEFQIGFRGNSAPLPHEVACCLTLYANPQPGVVRQSWRGRIYIGPMDAATLGAGGAATGGRPSVACRDLIRNRGKVYLDLLNAPIKQGQVVIYSRKQGQVYPVANIGVDDAWDTQRSRGIRATAMVKVDLAGEPGPSAPV